MSPDSTTTRERILQATVQALATHGHAGTTARSIAALGGFSPGVLYYHHSDLDALLTATAAHTSELRLAHYRAAVTDMPNAMVLVQRLRLLYSEDAASGHMEAVQELVAAARPGSDLASAITAQTRRWEELAEQVLRALVRGTPLARLVDPPVLARSVVAGFLGMQLLTHLDGDTDRAVSTFAQYERLAWAFDKLPRLRRGRTSAAR